MPARKNKPIGRRQTKRKQRPQLKRPDQHQVTTSISSSQRRHVSKDSEKKQEISEIVQTNETVIKSYPTAPVSPSMGYKLSRLYKGKPGITYELAPGTGADKERLLSQIIGPYVLRYMKPMSKVYYSTFVEKRTKALYNYYIKDIGDTVGNIIKKMQDKGIKVYLHGGIARDMFIGVQSADVDIIFDTHLNAMLELCEENKWPCGDVRVKNQYLNFGADKGISMEGSNLKGVFMEMPHKREATVNDLTIDLQTGLLIDISGYGLQDVLDRRLRLSPLPKYWERWAREDWKKPLRYFKLIQKGFKPMNQATHTFVTNYMRDNWEKVYEAPTSPGNNYKVKRIKHFLIKTMTQGTIDDKTGEYEFGPTEDKLYPFLQVLKLHLGKKIFNRIIAQFTDEDMGKLKDAKVLSSLRSYKAAQRLSDDGRFSSVKTKRVRPTLPARSASKTKKRAAK